MFAALYRILHGVAIGIDYGLSMLIWFRVETPMTVSSHAGLALKAGERWTVLAVLGRVLNALDPAHTDAAIAADIQRCTASLRKLQT
jgi:hypothetical protein